MHKFQKFYVESEPFFQHMYISPEYSGTQWPRSIYFTGVWEATLL